MSHAQNTQKMFPFFVLADPSSVVAERLPGTARLAREIAFDAATLESGVRGILAFTSKTKADRFCKANRWPKRTILEISDKFDFYNAFKNFVARNGAALIVDWSGQGNEFIIEPLEPLLKRIKESIDAEIGGQAKDSGKA